MSAPIAEIPPPAPPQPAKKAPLSLSVAVIVGLILGAVDVVLMLVSSVRLIPEISAIWENILIFGVLFLLYFLPLLIVWRGANWARWIMIAASGLGILSALTSDDSNVSLSRIQEIIDWLYVPYYIALIVFLLTPAMRRHFTGSSTKVPATQ